MVLGLGLDGAVPDAAAIWLFREHLVKVRAIAKLFVRFDAVLLQNLLKKPPADG